jgi:hypothetical protein
MDEVPCLLYPENAGTADTVTIEQATTMLIRAIQVSQQTPYQWSYIDKPPGARFSHTHTRACACVSMQLMNAIAEPVFSLQMVRCTSYT